jgi:polyhydroxybutyrate depolymerase
MNNRKKIVLLVLPLTVIAVLLSLSCLNSADTLNNQVGDHAGSIVWDGLERTYLVHIPPSYDKNKSMPLVIALHGGGGSAKGMVKLTKGGFNRLADKEGFIVVYPEGTEHKWNDGRDERFSQADDVGFISALIEHLAQSINIDRARIYATGISNGAYMSMRLARELSDKIVAVAPVAYSMQKKYKQVPVSTKPVSFLIITGTNDPLIPWQGGNTLYPNRHRMLGEILSVPQTVEVLVSHNQCSSTPTITYEPDKDPKDGTRVREEVYKNGKDGTEVILYAIEGGGHTWPGGWQYLPKIFIGKTNRDIDANEVIWNFFKKHVR